MTQANETLIETERNRIIGSMPIEKGNMEDFIEKVNREPSVLRLTVSYEVFDRIKRCDQVLLIRKYTDYMKSRLMRKDGTKREYTYVEICFDSSNVKRKMIVCEYNGYFISQSEHFIKYGEQREKVQVGNFVIKLGGIVKF